MRKLFYILFIACFLGTGLTAQNFQWAKQFAGSGSPLNRALNYPRSITKDATGNVYTTGCFGGTVDFDPSASAYTLATVSLSNTNVFISKLTPCGDFIWAKSFAGLKDDQAFCVKIDNSGNVITSGHFSGTTDFDPGPGVSNLVGTAIDPGFISKLTSAGTFVWARKFDVITIAVTPDASGNIYASGSFSGTVDFDPGAGVSNLTATGSADMFVVKLDASGNFLWAKKMGSSTGGVIGIRIAKKIFVDASANLYAAISFSGTVDFDPGAGVSNLTATSSSSDVVIIKLDAAGNFIWAKRFGGGFSSTLFFNSVDVDDSGNSYFSGSFSGTVDFDPNAGTFNLTSVGSAGGFDIFYAKIDAAGNLTWAKRTDVNATSFFLAIISIASDAFGNAYVTGNFNGTVDFDPSVATRTLSATSGDLFISTFDAAGNFKGAANSSGLSMCIGTDNSGSAYIGSFFGGVTTDFDSGPGTYTLTINPANHADIALIKFNINIAAIAGPTTVCSGATNTYSVNSLAGATGYTWTVPSGAVINSGQNTPTVSVTFGTLSGTVSVTPSYTCVSGTSTTTLAITVNATPTIGIASISSNAICRGGTVTITPNGASTYTLMPGSVAGTSFTVSTTATSVYTINGTNAAGCSSLPSTNLTTTITVNATPTIGLTSVSSNTICSGNNATITPNGASTYTLIPGSITGTNFTVSPIATTVYTINGTSAAGCVSSASTNITTTIAVNATPTIGLASVSSNSICSGTTVTITPNGANTYTLIPGNITGTSFTVSPTSTTIYTINGTNSLGCSSPSSTNLKITITVNATPTIGLASVSSNSICSGTTVTITPNGASTYTLLPGNVTGTSFTVSPIATTVYTINGTNVSGCSSSSSTKLTTTITVNATPTIGLVSVSSNSICSGITVTITPNGATTYTLIPGNVTGTSFTVSPIATTVYTINGTNTLGCSSSSSTKLTTTITVKATPTIGLVSVSSNTICSGTTVTITPNGASTYTLIPGNFTGTNFTVSPTSTTIYTINGTNALGCSSSSSTNLKTTITVNATPTIGIATISSNAICSGNTVTITPNGATTYTLLPGNVTGTSFTVAPLVNTTYTISGTSSSGCLSNSSTNLIRTITIDVTPTITIVSVSNNSVCSGNASVIIPGGASTYTLLPGNTSGISFTVNPSSTTVYTINGTSAGGCVNNSSTYATATIIVNTTPTIGLTSISNDTICAGSPVVIIPNGASTYTLLPGNVMGISFTVTPSVTTSYTINGTNSNGCVNNNSDGIYPVVTVSSLSITTLSTTGILCFGDVNGSASVSASGGSPAYNYLWSNGVSTSSISGVTAGSYTITVTDGLSCSSSKNIIISGPTNTLSVNSVSVTGACSFKANGGVSISVTGGTPNYSVLWNTGATGQILSNVVSGVYTATITDGNNCTLTISEVIPSLAESDVLCVELFIPEIFSPNADGVNDKFEIKKVSAYPNNTLSIFNRWGSLVYKKQGYNNEWNGTSNVGDKTSKDYLPAGAYYVVFDFGDGNTKQYTGFVQLEY